MTNTQDHLVLFMPSGKRGRFTKGTPVIDAARELGVYVESVCWFTNVGHSIVLLL